MKTTTMLSAAVLLFAGHLIPVDAGAAQPLDECVSLSDAHEGARFGSQYLMLKDGGTYYRVGFSGSCDALTKGSIVQVSTGVQKNRLCPTGSKVSSQRARCSVRTVEKIDGDDYERYARNGRR